MKRIKIESKSKNHFIGAWDLNDNQLMDNIINFFDSNPELHSSGKLSGGNIDRNIKDSIDININPKDITTNKDYKIFEEYFKKLIDCYIDYQKQYKILEIFKQVHMGSFNVQKYLVGGHFKKPHCERINLATCHRLFAWMTYLNDFPGEGGETKFEYFDMMIKPKKGKTLIWPAEWTHLHCGLPTKQDEKYIITGWFHMPDRAMDKQDIDL